jgi:membrane fusion protein, multidrug efflux system
MSEAPAPAPERAPRRWGRLALMFSVPMLLAGVGIWLWLTSGQSVSTDNAYVKQDMISISPEIAGRITFVGVAENQRIEAGTLLFRIDEQPFRIALAEAEAEIAGAEARVTTLETTAASMSADIATAERALSFARTNLDRERALMERGFNTRVRLDAADNAVSEAEGRLAEARAAAVRARAQLATGRTAPGTNPGILSARTRREQALYDLSRTEVRAPIGGVVTQADRLQRGQAMVSGIPALTIVAANGGWIEANFKETDLDRMRVGQRATIRLDAYPDLELTGHVASIGAGTGSEFSVLPAQNATGNWVKVTQRVPVRIAIDTRPARPLIAGLSAEVTVHFDQQRR